MAVGSRHDAGGAVLEAWFSRVLTAASLTELGQRGSLGGRYLYPSGSYVFLPSKNLLGEPYGHGFMTEPEDPRNRKSLLLQCTCGSTDCWFLLASIAVVGSTVVWSDFCQLHRDWKYDLGVFDRVS